MVFSMSKAIPTDDLQRERERERRHGNHRGLAEASCM